MRFSHPLMVMSLVGLLAACVPVSPPVPPTVDLIPTTAPPAIEETPTPPPTNTLMPTTTDTPALSPSPTEVPTIDQVVEKYTPERSGLVAKDQDGTVLMIINGDGVSYLENKIYDISEGEPLEIIRPLPQEIHLMIMDSIRLHKELYPDFEHDDDMWVAEDGKSYSFVTDDGQAHVINVEMPIIYQHTNEVQRNSREVLYLVNNASCGYSSEDGSLIIKLQLGDGWPMFGSGAMISPVKFLSRIQQITGAERPWANSYGVSRFTHNYIENWQQRIKNLIMAEYNLGKFFQTIP